MLGLLIPALHMGAGASPVEIPDVVGEAQASGTTELETAGFVVVAQTAYSASVPEGDIISQDPAGGTFAYAGTTVTITVSLGVQPAAVEGGGGGGGSIYYKRSKEKHPSKKLDEMLDEVAAEVMYRDITKADVPKATKEAAADVIRAEAKSEAAVPAVSKVDWAAVERDVEKVRRLLSIWRAVEKRRRILEDDDRWLMEEM